MRFIDQRQTGQSQKRTAIKITATTTLFSVPGCLRWGPRKLSFEVLLTAALNPRGPQDPQQSDPQDPQDPQDLFFKNCYCFVDVIIPRAKIYSKFIHIY